MNYCDPFLQTLCHSDVAFITDGEERRVLLYDTVISRARVCQATGLYLTLTQDRNPDTLSSPSALLYYLKNMRPIGIPRVRPVT